MRCCCLVVGLCLLANFGKGQAAEMDCNRRLDLNTVQGCCTIPKINFESYRGSCGKYLSNGGPHMNPCLYDCMFNASNVMSGMQLNVANAYRMNQRLLGGNKDFVDVYTQSLQNCTEHIDDIMRRIRRKAFRYTKCSVLAIYLGICTVENIFVHCPISGWRSSRSCEEARDFMLNCKCDSKGSVCMQL